MDNQRIKHIVLFSLKHQCDSLLEKKFLEDAFEILSGIAKGQKFELYKIIDSNRDYDHGIIIDFENQAVLDRYNNDPDHAAFGTERWVPEVEKYLVIDCMK